MNWEDVNKTRLVLLVALLFTALGAGVFRTDAIVLMAAMLCSAPIVGFLVGKTVGGNLRITREMPTTASVGQTISIRLTVHNVGIIPAFLVSSLSFLEKNQSLGGQAWARFTRVPSISPSLGEAIEVLGEPNLVFPSVRGRSAESGVVHWRLLRRGVYVIPGAAAGAFDPVGLYTQFPARGAPAKLVIVPRPLPLQRLEIGSGGRGVQNKQSRPSSHNATDFHGMRPYRAGESARRVHWKSTARTGQLHIVEWEEETSHDLCVFLDVQAGAVSGEPGNDTLESAILAAASAANHELERGQTVYLFWWSSTGQTLRLESVRGHHLAALGSILLALSGVKAVADPDATLARLVEAACEKNGHSSQSLPEAALILGTDLSDWDEGIKKWRMQRRAGADTIAKVLCFDSASFQTKKIEKKSSSTATSPADFLSKKGDLAQQSDQSSPAQNTAQVVVQPNAALALVSSFRDREVIRVRQGDSLVAALEKPL